MQMFQFCSASYRTKFAAGPARHLKPAGAGRGGHDLHLPDAPADQPDRAGHLPDLRHGAGARDSVGDGGTKPRTRQYGPTFRSGRRHAA